jgi:hypothetical protein
MSLKIIISESAEKERIQEGYGKWTRKKKKRTRLVKRHAANRRNGSYPEKGTERTERAYSEERRRYSHEKSKRKAAPERITADSRRREKKA